MVACAVVGAAAFAQGPGAARSSAEDVKPEPIALFCARIDCEHGEVAAARIAHEQDAARLSAAIRGRAGTAELFAAIDAQAESAAWLAHAACEAGAMSDVERDDYVQRLLDDVERRKATLLRQR